MGTEDLRKLGFLSRALRPADAAWGGLSEIAVAVASRGTGSAAGSRRMAQLLYRLTERESAPPAPVSSVFFRLSLEGRLVLASLRARLLDYAALGEILGMAPREVEQLAWKCRLALAGGDYPAAPRRAYPTCPDYEPSVPWTQAFLDGALESGSEKFFLRTHLQSCAGCREALNRARAVLARADAQIDQAVPDPAEDARELRELQATLELLEKRPLTGWGSLKNWLESRDGYRSVVIAAAILVLGLLLQILR